MIFIKQDNKIRSMWTNTEIYTKEKSFHTYL